MHFYYDLHIHTALSPCADSLMTPHNIINMARLKGINIISITDHNSLKNVEVTINLSRSNKLLEMKQKEPFMVIPGVEVQTAEDVHLLCYFKDIETALSFDSLLEQQLPDLPNRPSLFGEQSVFDDNDEIVDDYKKLLFNSIQLPIGKVVEVVQKVGGIAIPAHIDRPAMGLIAQLGFIPPHIPFNGFEISKNCRDSKAFKREHRVEKRVWHNSDAHQLEDISERINTVVLEEFTIDALFHTLGGEM